jgi:hypothetical protein
MFQHCFQDLYYFCFKDVDHAYKNSSGCDEDAGADDAADDDVAALYQPHRRLQAHAGIFHLHLFKNSNILVTDPKRKTVLK